MFLPTLEAPTLLIAPDHSVQNAHHAAYVTGSEGQLPWWRTAIRWHLRVSQSCTVSYDRVPLTAKTGQRTKNYS